MIPAYSPQARGRSERNFSTWQGRLPQELRLLGMRTLEEANKFLNEHYIADFNRLFMVPAAQRGTAFRSCRNRNLEMIFTQRFERTIDQDNTVHFHNLVMQIERAEWRPTLAGCKVSIHQQLDATLIFPKNAKPDGHFLRKLKQLARDNGLICDRCNGCMSERKECENWYLHKFRATYCTKLLRSGLDIRTVQQMKGHSDLASTLRYVRPAENPRDPGGGQYHEVVVEKGRPGVETPGQAMPRSHGRLARP